MYTHISNPLKHNKFKNKEKDKFCAAHIKKAHGEVDHSSTQF